MDKSCLQFRLTEKERKDFDELGYIIIEDALTREHVKALEEKTDEVYAKMVKNDLSKDLRGFTNFVLEDKIFRDMIDYPKTFTKIWDILGWNIKLYAAQMAVTPPSGNAANDKTFGWHQDSGQLNHDLEYSPKPRISLKVVYFLTDLSEPGRANFWVVPGSHLKDNINLPSDRIGQPEGAIPICAKPGTAVIFDRRLWHAATPNWSEDVTRKALFYGYGYRWIQSKFGPELADFWEESEPIRQQLLSKGVFDNFAYSPRAEDVPLREWMKEHCPERLSRR